MAQRYRFGWRVVGLAALAACAWLGLEAAMAEDKKPPRYPSAPSAKDVPIVPEAWKTMPRTPLAAGEIDKLLAEARSAEKVSVSPPINDEQFIRRVTLDLCGKPPKQEQIDAFLNDKDPAKRSKTIDRLLASDEFARHWGRYFRDVLLWRATDLRIVVRLPRTVALEIWLIKQLKQNRSWAEITRDLITPSSPLQHRHYEKGGESGFLLAHTGEDAAVERAADTSRVFLGLSIQCAQCHDHPDDMWRREHFHRLAAFFGRTDDRSDRTEQGGVHVIVGKPDGEYEMPDLKDPKKMHTVHPQFITDEKVKEGMSDADRRKALADLVTSPNNYWYAAAFVNRIWGVLMGQAFYQPVDNMGPLQEATYPKVLLRLADAFRASNHDIKGMFRAILNSEAYQSQFRLGHSLDQHLAFSAMYPSRLSGEAIWQSLDSVLGPFPDEMPDDGRVFRGGGDTKAGPFSSANPSLVYQVKQLFDFDPSLKPDDVESTITQAMMLMNNKKLNASINAKGDTPLGALVKAHRENDSAIQVLYLKALSRKPSARELDTCLTFVKEVGDRDDAFEDILWTLVNSTEFQIKR